MKWLVWLIVLIVIIGGGWYLLSSSNNAQQIPAPTATTTAPADIIPGTPNETYSNTQLSFSIEYPATANATSSFSTGYLPLTQTPVVAIELPQSMFAGTNLSEAGVYIGATSSPAVITDCSQPLQGESATSTVTIGGQSFAVFTSTGAAAGNIYQEKAYRTIQNGACLEIVELLHSGDIGNYPPGTVQQFDQAQFSDILDSIVQTYYPIPTGE